MAETNIKKLFIHVKAAAGQDLAAIKSKIIEKSTGALTDRIFFLENTGELIVKGKAYGLSDADASRITALEAGLTTATGIAKDNFGTAFTITDDSAIGKYVKGIAGVQSTDKTILITKTDTNPADLKVNIDGKSIVKDGTSGQISVGLDNIIDGSTIVKDGDKIKSGLKLIYDKKGATIDGTKLDHPQMRLVDNADKTVGTGVDVSDFIVDGLLNDVKYDASTHSIVFTWNSDSKNPDGSPHVQSTSIDISKLFNIEQLHTTTKDYLRVTTTNPTHEDDPHAGDKEGGICFNVDAIVDNHENLNQGHEITHTDAAENTAESYALTSNSELEGQIAGLADAKKVATAIKSVSQAVVDLGNARIAAETANKAAITAEATRAKAAEKVNSDAIAAEVTRAKAAEKVNSDAIAVLNGNENTNGSVAKSIKTAIDGLNAEITGQAQIKGVSATKPLISVKVTQANGKITGVDVNASVDTLTEQVSTNGEFLLGTTPIKAKELSAISTADPTFVTLQDAWMYGQCIKGSAIKEVQSDNNDYIKITREAKSVEDQTVVTKINFEPWEEVTTIDALNSL